MNWASSSLAMAAVAARRALAGMARRAAISRSRSVLRQAATSSTALGQPEDTAVIGDRDRFGGWMAGQAGHGHDVSADRHDEFRAGGEPYLAHRQDMARGRADQA